MVDVLTAAEVDQFIEKGCCTLKEAFSREQAAGARRVLWRRIEEKTSIHERDSRTWPEAYDIAEHLNDPEVLECFTDRLVQAIEQLVGRGRWGGDRRWGFWPVNFSYCEKRSYDVPDSGWHVDGNWFRHTLDSPKQGLLVIGLFTDIAPRCGGTIVSLGSHLRTARVLAMHPDGLDHLSLFRAVLSRPLGNFRELTGAEGDVVLAHPFLFHTRGMKHGGPPRIISNTEASLVAPMRVAGDCVSGLAPVEIAIRRALERPLPELDSPRFCRF